MTDRPPTARDIHALNRFGLGGRPGEVVAADTVAWLSNQLSGPDPRASAGPSLAECIARPAAVRASTGRHAATRARMSLYKHAASEQAAFVAAALSTSTPFRERLVWFFANHFAVQSGGNETTAATAGSFVRDAIRPNVGGSFAAMLLAAITHPAMICSLDDEESVGPASPLGLRTGKGINENLARETLELYSVGVDAGYTQADVDAFAYVLTGWGVSYDPASPGFAMDASAHQPGPQVVMGFQCPGAVDDGVALLGFLGTHPATYAHIAGKLVAHFTSDVPADSDVAAVAASLAATGGDIPSAMAVILGLPSAWIPLTKVRSPIDHVVAAARAAGAGASCAPGLVDDLALLTAPLWKPPFPNGWPDTGADWASPAQMELRACWSASFTGPFPNADPSAVAATALGPLLPQATTDAMASSSLASDRFAILLASPEFQRR